jgi:hypothetical protein
MIRRIFTEEEVFDLELKAHGRVQYDLGGSAERERIITLIQNKICFDNRDNGECEHSVCYGMIDLIALIKSEN